MGAEIIRLETESREPAVFVGVQQVLSRVPANAKLILAYYNPETKETHTFGFTDEDRIMFDYLVMALIRRAV